MLRYHSINSFVDVVMFGEGKITKLNALNQPLVLAIEEEFVASYEATRSEIKAAFGCNRQQDYEEARPSLDRQAIAA